MLPDRAVAEGRQVSEVLVLATASAACAGAVLLPTPFIRVPDVLVWTVALVFLAAILLVPLLTTRRGGVAAEEPVADGRGSDRGEAEPDRSVQ